MKNLVGGNWKLNNSMQEILMAERCFNFTLKNTECFVGVPYIYIEECLRRFPKNIRVAAQNFSEYENGAYTGEVSIVQLKEFGVNLSILGHSERRQIFNESDATINNKLKIAMKYGVEPVLCLGEPHNYRKRGDYIDYLENQYTNSIGEIRNTTLDIAYEPVWAIGNDVTPEEHEIEEVHKKIFDWNKKNRISGRIIYGGSVNKSNAFRLSKIQGLDGFLVGNASLDEDFVQIATVFEK